MRVFRVSHSFVAAASRRHARRRPRRAPARVSAAMDPDPVTNLRVGYRRNEMWSESLVGTVKQHDCHAFLVHGDAVEWPGKEFEPAPGHGDQPPSPAVVMHDALLDASGTYKGGIHKFEAGTNAVGSVKLNLAEAPGAAGGVAGDAAGDVLLFPQMRRHRLGPERVRDKNEIAAFVQSVVVDGDNAESTSIASSAHVFVCTHASRDARCGVCGPALVDAFRAAVAADSELRGRVEVRGCSHVGGHKYAGNVLVFAPRGGVFSGLGQKKSIFRPGGRGRSSFVLRRVVRVRDPSRDRRGVAPNGRKGGDHPEALARVHGDGPRRARGRGGGGGGGGKRAVAA